MEIIEKGLSKVGKFEVVNIPVGQAVLLLAGLGLNDIMVPALTSFLKMPILSGAAISVISKLPVVEKFIGPTLSDVLAATAIATGIDEQFQLRNRTKSMVSGLLSKVGVSTVATTGVNTQAAVSTRGVALGKDFGMMSEPERRILATMRAA